jgi:hypothetical protein
MKLGVPTAEPVVLRLSASESILATPKSRTLT